MKTKMKTTYNCSDCGKAVIPCNGDLIWACPHKGGTVIADIAATAYGISGLIQQGYKDIPTPEEVAKRGV